MKEPSLSTIKRLFALSNNTCAFPRCDSRIVADSGIVTGKICHIKARKPGGSRYDTNQADEERHSFSNLVLLCGQHHDIVDKEPKLYTVEVLIEMKLMHEKNGRRELTQEDSIFAGILLNDYRRIEIKNNKGNIILNSPGSIQANSVNISTQKRNIKVLPPEGTVSQDLNMSRYIKHLIGRYNEFASSDTTRKSKFSHGAIYRNIESRFGSRWEFVPVHYFEDLARYLQGRIDKTMLAQINKSKGRKSYSCFQEYCEKYSGSS